MDKIFLILILMFLFGCDKQVYQHEYTIDKLGNKQYFQEGLDKCILKKELENCMKNSTNSVYNNDNDTCLKYANAMARRHYSVIEKECL